MKSIFSAIVFTLFTISVFAQSGYKITVNIEGVKDSMLYLANHYGDKQYIKDSAMANSKGTAVFQGKEKLQSGMYLVVLPDKNFFEFIVDDNQHFTLTTKRSALANSMKVTGSKDNQVFFSDIQFIDQQRKKFEALKSRRDANAENADSVKVLDEQIKAIDENVKSYREKLIKENPELFYTRFLKALEEPKIPDNPDPSDSLFAYRFYKSHFFDNLDFSDARFVYSPAYHQKLNRYMKQVVVQHPDSLIKESDIILELARSNPEVFKYTLAYLLNEQAGSKIMGMDAVYVHLVDNYYAKGDASWIDEKQLENIKKDADKLRPFLIGNKVPNLVMKDEKGNWRSLAEIKKDYTILYFWDADCGHCKKETPKLKALYDKVKDKGVEVYAVSIEYTRDKWEAFIKENDLNFINLIDEKGETNFRSLYKIEATPVVYLLDKDKKIVAKRLDVENLEKMLEHLINNDQPF